MSKRFESLWAIRPEAVLTVVHLLELEAAGRHGHMPTAPGAALFGSPTWEAAKPYQQGPTGNKVAVIPIQGVLTQDGPSYYGTNYQTIADAAEKAAADPDVKRIVLAVDSPGGQVTGLPETAAVIAAAAKIKPVSAIVEGQSASAAYWLTSQASDITLTPSGEVGSVGVRMMHADMSGALEKAGITVTEMHSGEHKTEWSPYKPLSDDTKANMQTRLDASHEEFLGGIAAGRGKRVTKAMTDGRYGEGRMHSAQDALAGGLVDKIQAARDFYRTIVPAQAETSAPFGLRARVELERLR